LRASRGIHDLIYPGDLYCTTDLQLAVKKQFPQVFPLSVEESVPVLFPSRTPVTNVGRNPFASFIPLPQLIIATMTLEV